MPQSVHIVSSKSNLTSITVKWNELKCIEQNSNITGYTIRLNQTALTNVSSDTREFTVADLLPSTLYTIEIAANSINGTGPFQSTSGSTLQPTGR
jgi:ribosomal 30S subunit maturation factor RimM